MKPKLMLAAAIAALLIQISPAARAFECPSRIARAEAPKQMLARAYVFANGVKGEGPLGPLGFQPDVFEPPPGSPGYTPLRTVMLVTWEDEANARTLTSATEVEKSRQGGDIMLEEPGVAVNMPMVTWPGGQR
jgi:hypothetical protein